MTSADRRSSADGHILISGTGRAGTTVLVQYFTVLGFDTGYTVEQALSRVDPISRGGLERSLGRGGLTYVSKSPWYAKNLGKHLADGRIEVRSLIVPIRDLHAAAESRREVSRQAALAGRDPYQQPGGVSFGAKSNPRRQEQRLAVNFYSLMRTAAEFGIETHLLPFPEFARDHDCLYAGLAPLLARHGVTPAESKAAFERVVDPRLIRDYGKP
jgi:hypothetical protein